jgi:hypothetical protein
MNAPRLLERHALENGLTLEFWDYSRPLVGDRWFVRLEARIAIAVRAETLPPELQAHAAPVVEGRLAYLAVKDRIYKVVASGAASPLGDVFPARISAAPALGRRYLYVGCQNSVLYAIEPGRGRIQWSHKFTGPILIGDTIRIRVKIASKRETKKLDRGIVVEYITMLNQRGEVVQEGEHGLMALRKGTA